jgi:hypothetical protein
MIPSIQSIKELHVGDHILVIFANRARCTGEIIHLTSLAAFYRGERINDDGRINDLMLRHGVQAISAQLMAEHLPPGHITALRKDTSHPLYSPDLRRYCLVDDWGSLTRFGREVLRLGRERV